MTNPRVYRRGNELCVEAGGAIVFDMPIYPLVEGINRPAIVAEVRSAINYEDVPPNKREQMFAGVRRDVNKVLDEIVKHSSNFAAPKANHFAHLEGDGS